MLSHLPLLNSPADVSIPGETILLMDMLHCALVKFFRWKYETLPTEKERAYGCLLWGNRVVVPPARRTKIKEKLHEGHPGVSCMKSSARSFVWWSKMDKEFEKAVNQCNTCQHTRHLPAAAPFATLGMATKALDPCTCWLCRTIPCSYVSHTLWRTLQMDGSEMCCLSYIIYHHWAHMSNFFNTWFARNVGNW